MSKFTVVYDACVLYPAPLRDALMRLALTDLFKAHWTDHIHDEWINALLRAKKHSPESLLRARELMDLHVRDAKVYGYEPLIEGVSLPVKAVAQEVGYSHVSNFTKAYRDYFGETPGQTLRLNDTE